MATHLDNAAAVPLQTQEAPSQFLTFQLEQELFGLNIDGIHEIIEYRAPTPVPTMPACVRGVINLRGAVVPVVDLQLRLGRAPSRISRRSCIVIVSAAEGGTIQAFGLLVDAVSAVLDIPAQQIEAAPSFGSGIRDELLQGMGKLEDRLVILLDRARLLRVDEIADVALPAAA
ncbi:chemotaxis protein CheW [Xanthomonas sp. GW]|uniref:chemotaxis protein CheW n=1 Tax=unclassified Xanthomonas TaxID=2643310 RepID=UPI00163AE873|nr:MULTISPECIES: chemotaxis protein CheW [unclassified Xanthomonas]QNH12410.1 chemotaxis protein CheW [Xanthomonas sp. SI]QNH17448.1 chemotaxis protein CheW [Xanthomonas sp. SS]QNH21839.1 chemotaxis protein CheW [Xanthomonas sp. GW]